MSTIAIRDLHNSTEMDRQEMGAVRGGFAWDPDVKVNLNVNQSIAQLQDIKLNVLNGNGVIGAGFTGPTVNLGATQKAFNNAVIPKLF